MWQDNIKWGLKNEKEWDYGVDITGSWQEYSENLL
jgi:hypothetical protein